MKTETVQQLPRDVQISIAENKEKREKLHRSLDNESRTNLSTEEAAYHLNRKEQTLRSWACFENGPIHPVRINGRLAWPVVAIRTLLNGGV